MRLFSVIVISILVGAACSAKDIIENQKRAAEGEITRIKGIDPKDVRIAIKPDTEATFFAVTDTEILHCGEVWRSAPFYRIPWSAVGSVEATPDMMETKPSFMRGHVAGIRLRLKTPVKFPYMVKYFGAGDGIFVFTPVIIVTFENGVAKDCMMDEKGKNRLAMSQYLQGILKEFAKN